MKREYYLLASGILAGFTALLHTIAGTLEVQELLLQSALPKEISLLLYACWHLVSVTLSLSAAALLREYFLKSLPANPTLVKFVSLLWLLFGFVFIVVALFFSGLKALLILPQWTLLIPVGVLGLLGSRNSS